MKKFISFAVLALLGLVKVTQGQEIVENIAKATATSQLNKEATVTAPTVAIKALKAAMNLPKKTFKEDLESTDPILEKPEKLKQEVRNDFDDLETCDYDA